MAATAKTETRLFCPKCERTLSSDNFYTRKNGEKTQLCKKCLTMHVDAFDEETFLWILEEIDVPYVEPEWNVLRDRAFALNPDKIDNTAIFGKYLSKMRLSQWKKRCWADTEKIKAELAEQREAAEARSKEDAEAPLTSEYSSKYKTLTPTKVQNALYEPPAPQTQQPYFFDSAEMPDFTEELTEDDKIQLALKWGRFYKPYEWVILEKNYVEMATAFSVTDPDTINTLKLICKTDLKMNQALDSGDIESYQKLSRVSSDLRKSGKFTAAQNKEKKEDFVDSIGKFVYYCEKWGGQIPRFDISTPQDIVDKVINDLKSYNKSLVYQDSALASQIEEYLKNRKILDEKKRNEEEAKMQGKEAVELTNEDFQEHYDMIERQKEEDSELYEEMSVITDVT